MAAVAGARGSGWQNLPFASTEAPGSDHSRAGLLAMALWGRAALGEHFCRAAGDHGEVKDGTGHSQPSPVQHFISAVILDR